MGVTEAVAVDINSELYGLGIYHAKQKIQRMGFSLGNISYQESPIKRLMVLKAICREEADADIPMVDLHLTGSNPIKNLPSMYQSNDFLSRFLWVFQHMAYETTAILDNLHHFFTPMDAPNEFVEWIAAWFGLNLEHLGNEDTARFLLQNAVPLYRWRGTKKGLQAMLKIITGIEPIIEENSMPYGPYAIVGDGVEAHVLDRMTARNYFTVFFQVAEQHFSPQIRARIQDVIKTEKPAHTQCFLCYQVPEKPVRKTTVILADTMALGNDGMAI